MAESPAEVDLHPGIALALLEIRPPAQDWAFEADDRVSVRRHGLWWPDVLLEPGRAPLTPDGPADWDPVGETMIELLAGLRRTLSRAGGRPTRSGRRSPRHPAEISAERLITDRNRWDAVLTDDEHRAAQTVIEALRAIAEGTHPNIKG